MSDTPINKPDLFAALPDEWASDLRGEIKQLLRASPRKVVVLDDDPTGTQTVHGLPVLTDWSVEALRAELSNDLPAFYVLTNSRSLPPAEAEALATTIGHNLRQAGQQAERPFAVVSRSDSTLRGHFPGEVAALEAALGQQVDAWLLVPFFAEGGRLTINDVHYLAIGDLLTPVGATEFARDAAFGFRSSNLRQWVEEKSAGRVPAEQVVSVSLEDIRLGGPQRVAERLDALGRGSVCIVNAVSARDLEVFVCGLLISEAGGRHYLYRTAASFVPVRAGLEPRSLLTRDDILEDSANGGLIVVGSYVPTTSRQVEVLRAEHDLLTIEVAIDDLLTPERRERAISEAISQADSGLRAGRNVLIVTSRQLVTGANATESLSIGTSISDALCAIVQSISVRPRFLVAKGGITSSDLATKGLGVERALVLGQVLPGVPVWKLGGESRHPGLSYIVFPGNVGEPDALARIVTMLNTARKAAP